MQQYFQVDGGTGNLTIFHTDDSVSFDIEHFGGFQLQDTKLLSFLKGNENRLDVQREVDRLREDQVIDCGYLERMEDGLSVHITDRRETTVKMNSKQVECLIDSITVGSVERYEDGQYPVESVDKSGSRDRAEHTT